MLVDVTAELAGHLATALRMHRDWAARTGIRVPAGFAELEQAFTSRARRGQPGTALEELWVLRQSPDMTPRLLTYSQTATALSCSERQVKRLVADGLVPAVRVGAGAARIRVSDLDAYVTSLQPARGAA
jgi:excisionase family DNA binding protein